MFGGDGDLMLDYTYGTYVEDFTESTPDFAKPCAEATEIKFVTGDGYLTATTDYASLRSLIDAGGADLTPNLAWTTLVDGVTASNYGNIFNRGRADTPQVSFHTSGSESV